MSNCRVHDVLNTPNGRKLRSRCPRCAEYGQVGESYTLIRMRLGHAATQQFLKSLDHTHRLQRIFVVESQEEAAFALLRRYDDQDFSFVDATSFVVMKTLGLRDAFTFDKHFATAGFMAVPMAS